MTVSTLRGGFDRGPGGSAEATAGAQYAALAQAAMELARAWASAAAFVEPDPLNHPGKFSAFHYSLLAKGGQWFRGAGAPDVGLGEDGNYYVDELTGDLYQKTAGSWVFVLNLKGADGVDGAGVPTGGNTGQVLVKASNANFDTTWVTQATGQVPVGGTTGQILTKVSNADLDTTWTDIPPGTEFYFQATPPTPTSPGAEWIDSDTGVKYTWVDDGTSAQWVEFGPSVMPVTNSVSTDSLWDAKGDLAVGTGANTASKLAVGTNGYVLTADSTAPTGLKWAQSTVASPFTIGGRQQCAMLWAQSTGNAVSFFGYISCSISQTWTTKAFTGSAVGRMARIENSLTSGVAAVGPVSNWTTIYNTDYTQEWQYEFIFGTGASVNVANVGSWVCLHSQGGTTNGSFGVPANYITDMLGLGRDAGFPNWQFTHRTGSGTATKVDTGIAFAADQNLRLVLTQGTAGSVHMLLQSLANDMVTVLASASYTASTALPADGTPMLPTHGHSVLSGTVSASTMWFASTRAVKSGYN